MYKVIIGFFDKEDKLFEYFSGDVYPRKGYKPTQKRIKELSSKSNTNKRAFIKVVKEND